MWRFTSFSIITLIVSLSILSCSNPQKTSDSIIYKSKRGNYSFIAYNKPDYNSHTTLELTSHMHSYQYKDYFFQTAYFKLKQPFVGKEDVMLKNMLGGLSKDPGSHLVRETNIDYLGHPGKEALISTSDGKSAIVRIYIIDSQNVYKLMVINDGDGNLMTDEVKYFMNTIHINDVKVVTPPEANEENLYLTSSLELKDLHQLLYMQNDYSDEILTNGGWEKASEFDELVTIRGNRYHTYNYIYPNDNESISLVICPFVNIYYQPDTATFSKLFKQILDSKTLIQDSTAMGYRILAFKDGEDRYLAFIGYGPNQLQIWKGLTGIEHLRPLDKEYILSEYGLN